MTNFTQRIVGMVAFVCGSALTLVSHCLYEIYKTGPNRSCWMMLQALFELVTHPLRYLEIQPQISRLLGVDYKLGVGLLVLGISISLLAAVVIANRRTNGKRVNGTKVTEIFGSASWAEPQLVRKLGLVNNEGIVIGETQSGEYIRHAGPEHCAVIAPTRSGKGAGIVIPTLLSWRGSVLTYDLKGENWKATAGYRSKFSHAICFNPNSTLSARYNPLAEVRLGVGEVRDVQNIVDMIVDPDGSGYSDHWIKTGHSLLVGAILHILYAAPIEERNLPGVAKFLSNPEQTIVETLREMMTYPHRKTKEGAATHPVVAAAARDMLNKSENERSGVLSTAMSFLTLYRDPIVAQNISESDFRIIDLMDAGKPLSIYLVVPPSDADRLKPLIRLMINQIGRRLTEEYDPPARKHKLLMLLDEFHALGKLEFFQTSLAFIAGYGIKAMLIFQAINQIRHIYGDRNSVLDNMHVQVFFAPNTIETADYISRSLGQTTEIYSTESESGRKGSFWLDTRSVSTHYAARALLNAAEILQLDDTKEIIFVGGNKPILANKIRFFLDRNFEDRRFEPPELTRGKPKIPDIFGETSISRPDPKGERLSKLNRKLEVISLEGDVTNEEGLSYVSTTTKGGTTDPESEFEAI